MIQAPEIATSAQVRFLTVGKEREGQRIDNFLRVELKGAPKTLVYRLLRKGEIRVNKKRVKPDYKLVAEDLIRLPPIRLSAPSEVVPVSAGLTDHLSQAVLFENEALLVLNKPSGLAVHGGSGVNLGLIEALRQIRPKCAFLELVHRLDRDTSGCVMIAKKRSMLRFLHEQLREKKIKKFYHALVSGKWSRSQQQINVPLQREEVRSSERFVRVHPEGKASLTRFALLRRFGDFATLVEASPVTGRTHQIRVHCQFAGHAIFGDSKYADDAILEQCKKMGLRRLMLHAAELQLALPDGTSISVQAPYDDEMTRVVNRLVDQYK